MKYLTILVALMASNAHADWRTYQDYPQQPYDQSQDYQSPQMLPDKIDRYNQERQAQQDAEREIESMSPMERMTGHEMPVPLGGR